MTDPDKANLTAERAAINARISAAPNDAAKARVLQDFGERLAHLDARLAEETAPPPPETPAPPASK